VSELTEINESRLATAQANTVASALSPTLPPPVTTTTTTTTTSKKITLRSTTKKSAPASTEATGGGPPPKRRKISDEETTQIKEESQQQKSLPEGDKMEVEAPAQAAAQVTPGASPMSPTNHTPPTQKQSPFMPPSAPIVVRDVPLLLLLLLLLLLFTSTFIHRIPF